MVTSIPIQGAACNEAGESFIGPETPAGSDDKQLQAQLANFVK